jgi:hypothetical protein
MNRIFRWCVLFLIAALPAAGQGIAGPSVSGSSVDVPFSLPGGVTGDVTVSFESVTGLTPDSLGVSVQAVSPTDAGLLARLPPGAAIPAGFPVLVRIEPTPSGGLSFTGVATIQIRTPNLPSTADVLRLVAAPLGGVFAEITAVREKAPRLDWNTDYRVIGTKGGFSEFLIVADPTPLDQVIAAKLDRLDRILADNAGAIPEPVRDDLAGELAAVRSHSLPGDEAAALQDLDLFLDMVERHSGSDIPDVWRAARDRVNVAGLLRAGGNTLGFSLHLRQELGR